MSTTAPEGCWVTFYFQHESSLDSGINLAFDTQDKNESPRKRSRSLSKLTLNSQIPVDLRVWVMDWKKSTWHLRNTRWPRKRIKLEQIINQHSISNLSCIVDFYMTNADITYTTAMGNRCVKVFFINGQSIRATLLRKFKNKNPIYTI